MGIHEPRVADPLPSVLGRLLRPIDLARRIGEDFAHPVGRQLEEGDTLDRGHARATPSPEIGNEHIRAEVQLGLVQGDPTPRTSSAALEGWAASTASSVQYRPPSSTDAS